MYGTIAGSAFKYATRYLPKNGIDTVNAKPASENFPYPLISSCSDFYEGPTNLTHHSAQVHINLF